MKRNTIKTRAHQVISACNKALCDHALHIQSTYGKRNFLDCVGLMTDDEWTAWTKQPSHIRAPYHKFMSSASIDAALFVQAQFEVNAGKQAKMVIEILEETV